MWDGFLKARKHLVIFLNTFKFVDMILNLRDEFMWRKEIYTKLIAWLPNVFNACICLHNVAIAGFNHGFQ